MCMCDDVRVMLCYECECDSSSTLSASGLAGRMSIISIQYTLSPSGVCFWDIHTYAVSYAYCICIFTRLYLTSRHLSLSPLLTVFFAFAIPLYPCIAIYI